MSCLFFSNRVFIVCSQLYIFLTNILFTYICAYFWLFCCYICTLDARTDVCLGVIGLGKRRNGSCVFEASMRASLALRIILGCEHHQQVWHYARKHYAPPCIGAQSALRLVFHLSRYHKVLGCYLIGLALPFVQASIVHIPCLFWYLTHNT
jgi:hypothetical protein